MGHSHFLLIFSVLKNQISVFFKKCIPAIFHFFKIKDPAVLKSVQTVWIHPLKIEAFVKNYMALRSLI